MPGLISRGGWEAHSQLWLLWARVCEAPQDECPEVAGRGVCEPSLGPAYEQVYFYSELMDLQFTLNF